MTKTRTTSWLTVTFAALLLSQSAGAADKHDKHGLAPKAAAKAPPVPTPPPATAPATTKPAPVEEMPAAARGEKDEPGKAGGTNLPIPRFVSLRTDPVNLRTGPGPRYPIDWVYVRRHLPVEVLGEFDTWRRIRDPEGSEGWVHQSMLSGHRTAIIVNGSATLRRDVNEQAPLIASLEEGVVVNVQRCPAELSYCRVEVRSLQGWMKREQLWGVYPNEVVQ